MCARGRRSRRRAGFHRCAGGSTPGSPCTGGWSGSHGPRSLTTRFPSGGYCAAGRARTGWGCCPDRLTSALEAERGGTRVSEGVSEDWAAVARAISDRMREFGWNQRELAERSHVSVAVVREIQRNTVQRRRSPRTLESLSVALGWKPGHLFAVLTGQVQHPGLAMRPRSTLPRYGLASIPLSRELTRSSSLPSNLRPISPR